METNEAKTNVDPATTKENERSNAGSPLCSVIVLNYKTPGLLKYCIRGFVTMGYSFPYEVIVVDNASEDGSVEMMRTAYPSVRVIASSENRGFAAGNNQGMRVARGKYILIANPDVIIRPGALETLIAFLEAHPKAAIVAPQIENPDGSIQDSCHRFHRLYTPLLRRTILGRLPFGQRHLASFSMHDVDRSVAQTIDWALAACILVRTAALETIGELDERYFLYFEDTDWCRRAWARGYEVWYEPRARVTHYHRRASADQTGIASLFENTLTRIHISSAIKYFWKWRGM